MLEEAERDQNQFTWTTPKACSHDVVGFNDVRLDVSLWMRARRAVGLALVGFVRLAAALAPALGLPLLARHSRNLVLASSLEVNRPAAGHVIPLKGRNGSQGPQLERSRGDVSLEDFVVRRRDAATASCFPKLDQASPRIVFLVEDVLYCSVDTVSEGRRVAAETNRRTFIRLPKRPTHSMPISNGSTAAKIENLSLRASRVRSASVAAHPLDANGKQE